MKPSHFVNRKTKLDDDYDMKAVSEYEAKKKAGTLATRDIREACKDLGIDWDDL